MDYKNVFKKACLVQLNSSVWQCSRVLNQAVLAEKLGENNEWLRGRKYLINPELVGAHQDIRPSESQPHHQVCTTLSGDFIVPDSQRYSVDHR